jgi:hypothetical protein
MVDLIHGYRYFSNKTTFGEFNIEPIIESYLATLEDPRNFYDLKDVPHIERIMFSLLEFIA